VRGILNSSGYLKASVIDSLITHKHITRKRIDHIVFKSSAGRRALLWFGDAECKVSGCHVSDNMLI
jgi:hypothetical protein